jgi:hypothetical protein
MAAGGDPSTELRASRELGASRSDTLEHDCGGDEGEVCVTGLLLCEQMQGGRTKRSVWTAFSSYS